MLLTIKIKLHRVLLIKIKLPTRISLFLYILTTQFLYMAFGSILIISTILDRVLKMFVLKMLGRS